MQMVAVNQLKLAQAYADSPLPGSDITHRITFEPTKVGKESVYKLSLSNSHDYNVKLKVSCDNKHFKLSHETINFLPNMQKEIKIIFKPLSKGTFSGVIVFSENGLKTVLVVVGRGE